MKNKLLLITTSILFLASCRNDDSSETSNNKIIGKWFYSKQIIVFRSKRYSFEKLQMLIHVKTNRSLNLLLIK